MIDSFQMLVAGFIGFGQKGEKGKKIQIVGTFGLRVLDIQKTSRALHIKRKLF